MGAGTVLSWSPLHYVHQHRTYTEYVLIVLVEQICEWTLAGRLIGWSTIPFHPKKVAGFDSQSGHNLGCGFDPKSERIWEATDRCFCLPLMYLSLSLPPPLRIYKNIFSDED